MNKISLTIVSVVAGLALIVGVIALNKTPERIVGQQGVQGQRGEQGPAGPQGPQGERGPAGSSGQSYGAVTSPVLPYNYLSVGGVTKYYASMAMRSATTTPCSMQGPAATSSLEFVSWQITTGTSTAATIDIGTSTTAYATTTVLVSQTSVASGAQGYASWRPTGGSVDDAKVPPSGWVNVKTGAGLGGYTFGGRCQAVFVPL